MNATDDQGYVLHASAEQRRPAPIAGPWLTVVHLDGRRGWAWLDHTMLTLDEAKDLERSGGTLNPRPACEVVPLAEIDRLRTIEEAARFIATDDFDDDGQRSQCWDDLRRLLAGVPA